jgi:hypothetical protein
MGQATAANGFFAYDPAVGNLDLVHSGPENDQDSFTQTALTVEGKVSDFDIVYSGGWFVRNQHSIADYATTPTGTTSTTDPATGVPGATRGAAVRGGSSRRSS